MSTEREKLEAELRDLAEQRNILGKSAKEYAEIDKLIREKSERLDRMKEEDGD